MEIIFNKNEQQHQSEGDKTWISPSMCEWKGIIWPRLYNFIIILSWLIYINVIIPVLSPHESNKAILIFTNLQKYVTYSII